MIFLRTTPGRKRPIWLALLCVAAGCAGRGADFTPRTAANAPETLTGSVARAQPATAPLHGPVFAINNPGSSPFALFGYGDAANGDVAPTDRLLGKLSGLFYPTSVGLDGHGYAYVGQDNVDASTSDPYEIAIYAPPLDGDKAPVATIAGGNPHLGGLGLAVTAQGAIYVANASSSGNGYLSEFAPGAKGNVTPVAYIQGSRTLLHQPVAVAVGATGKIYAANAGVGATSGPGGGAQPATITIYAPGATGDVAPVDRFNLSVDPTALAVDKTGAVYVASSTGGDVSVYAAGSHTARAVLGTPLLGTQDRLIPLGVAVDAAGYAYVSNVNLNYSDLLVYAPGATSASAPIATVKGGATGLTGPKGVAVPPIASAPTPAPTAKPTATPTPVPTPKPTPTSTPPPAANQAAYVSDVLSRTLLGFAVGATASSKPLVEISGSKTLLYVAASAFPDAHGNMWVAEQDDGSGKAAVLEFKAGTNGNVAPIRHITGPGGPNTINDALDVVTDTAGNIYVLDTSEFGSNLLVFAPTANGPAVATQMFPGASPASSLELDPQEKNLYLTTTGANALPEVVVIPLPLRAGSTVSHTIATNYAPAGTYLFSGLGFDRAGNLYVAADPQGPYASAIFEFPAGKFGTVTPSRILYGSTILSPDGVGVDGSGLVYVANYPNTSTNAPDAITVYAPGSSTPVRSITNSAIQLPGLLRVGPYVK
jgi:hypothetical protein